MKLLYVETGHAPSLRKTEETQKKCVFCSLLGGAASLPHKDRPN